MFEAALSILPFLLIIFSCIALATFIFRQLSLTLVVQRAARYASIGVTTDNTITNHIDRTIPTTSVIKTRLINYGKVFGLFPSYVDANAAIKVCQWDPTTTPAPATNCATDTPQLQPGLFFTISVSHPVSLAYGAFTANVHSTILGKVEQ